MTDIEERIEPELAALAAAYGVATSYQDWSHRPMLVAAGTVRRVLGLLGVDASTPEAVQVALAEAETAAWRRLVPPTVVVRQEDPAPITIHFPFAERPQLRVLLEDGSTVRVVDHGPPLEEHHVDGHARMAVPFHLPIGLPLGWHRLEVIAGAERAESVLVVAPTTVGLPAGFRRGWGWMVQLYSIPSAASWGMGDYADLREVVRWSGAELGAGLVLCNPLHAFAPVAPIENSPYYPSSRRFRSPLYLRISDTAEYGAADAATRARVDALRLPPPGQRIDRDAVWTAKCRALELLFPSRRPAALAAFQAEHGAGLADFGLFCALAERHGVPWQDWPSELHHRDAPAVARARRELAERIEFHSWLQLLCDEQLAAAAQAARDAGMPIGVVHDLAVGVDAGGSDGWALQDDLVLGASVGAPPDSFNQRGQDWRLPPWRPDRLAETGYAPIRDMLRGVLRHAGGVRIDHVMGLFRMWWVPAGASAAEGTYVQYDAEALLGVLALEAHRAGAVVIGEDLGTVEPRVATMLADRSVLGSSVLWFERDVDVDTGADLGPLPPKRWRPATAASVTTHDLPTAAGFLVGEHVRVRAELAQLGRPVEQEQAHADRERVQLLELLVAEGLLGADVAAGIESGQDADLDRAVAAMYALLTRAPCRLVLAGLGDAIGDRRQPNLPGTIDEYPNWRLPVAAPSPTGPQPMLLEDLEAAPAVRRLADVLRTGVVKA
jgi:4-alpha-glucanotransferase